MKSLKVNIYASNNICGGIGKQLVCSVDTDSSNKSNIVIVCHNIISRLDFDRLGETQKLILNKLTTLEALGNGRKIKLREFDIECMKRVIDSIDDHPDFECFYDSKVKKTYNDLAIVSKEDNSIVMKIDRDYYDNIDHVYTPKSSYRKTFSKFIDMILYTGHTDDEIVKMFKQVNITENSSEVYEFRNIEWDMIPDDGLMNSSQVRIECSTSSNTELISDIPLFNLTYSKLSGYYTLKVFKHVSTITNLLDSKDISNSLVDKINEYAEDNIVESFDDLQDDIIELFKLNNGLIFDIICDEGPVISIDSDDYCFPEEEIYLEDDSDNSNYCETEEKKEIGFVMLRDTNRADSLEDIIAFAFQYTGRLYPRVCDNFIADLNRANNTIELANELSKLNNNSFETLYDFKARVDEILEDANKKKLIQFKSRLEVLMNDNVDIRDFKNMLSVTIINKRNNMSVGRLRFIKNKLNDQVSVSRQVTVNGYSSLSDNIRESVKKAISHYPSVINYDSGNLAGVLKAFVSTDELELIIIKDGVSMYVDRDTRIIYGSDGSRWFDIDDTSKQEIYFSPNTPYEMSDKYDGYKKYESKKISNQDNKITFDDVVGMDQVKEKLYDVIDQFKNRAKYAEWGIKPIRGVLLHGPSGTGKSFISEALANEVDAKFVKKSSGDIMSKYIGQSGQNVKKIFDEARQSKGNTIIFIDEIDAIASKRTDDDNKERNATLNELLVQMSSSDNENIFMIFATNLVDLLDPAFLRSGRCDFKIEVPLPDFEMRKGILEKASGKRPLSDDLDFSVISRNMSGLNCADVAHISNESARRALKAKKDKVEHSDYESAIEDMICGTSIKTTKLSDKEKTTTSYHEIGHFFMNHIYDLRKAKKISILPRGSALGFVLYANEKEDDKFLYSKNELVSKIKTLLAGRAMEDIFLDDISTGASDDLKRANNIARDIICKYGFNDSLLVYDENDIMSRNKINLQIKDLLDECYADVKETLKSERDLVESLSKYLYDKEDVTGDELVEYMDSIKAGNEN